MDPKLRQEEANQAPPVNSPSYMDNALAEVREDQEKDKETVASSEANALARLSEMGEWEVLKKRMLSQIDAMRRAESTRMGTGNLNLESIGLRSVVINEIADAMQRVITMVESRKRQQIVINSMPQEDIPDTVGLETSEINQDGEASK